MCINGRLLERQEESRGGGVLVYVPESFLSWRRIDLEMEGIEAIWIEIRFQKREVLMCTAYCPPGASQAVIERICETRDPMNWEHFRKLRNLVKRQLKDAKIDHSEGVCRDAARQLRRMWKEIDRVLGQKQRRGISVIRTSQGEPSNSQQLCRDAISTSGLLHI